MVELAGLVFMNTFCCSPRSCGHGLRNLSGMVLCLGGAEAMLPPPRQRGCLAHPASPLAFWLRYFFGYLALILSHSTEKAKIRRYQVTSEA